MAAKAARKGESATDTTSAGNAPTAADKVSNPPAATPKGRVAGDRVVEGVYFDVASLPVVAYAVRSLCGSSLPFVAREVGM